MKKISILLVLLMILSTTSAYAYRKGSHPSQSSDYSQDDYGHWTRNDNLYKDSDGDGRINKVDRNDSNPWR